MIVSFQNLMKTTLIRFKIKPNLYVIKVVPDFQAMKQ